ncbi:MAG TPA: YwaF family protein [Clostridia bacterium]|nr:YwaF family protein [Clostridia bacterium]
MSYFWSGNGGVPGDFAYGKIHLGAVAALIVVTLLMCIIGSKLSTKNRRKVLIVAAALSFGFEIFWRGVWIGRGVPVLETWPLYPCNFAGVLVPLIAFSNNKTLKEIFYVFAFIGGIVTFVYPEDIFVNSVLNFSILKSILQHTAIIFIPVFEYFTGQFKPQFKKVWLAIIGLFVNLFNSEYISRFLGIEGDFIFLRSGLPFVIPGVPQVFILGTIAIVVMVAFYAVLDRKGSRAVLRRKKKRS